MLLKDAIFQELADQQEFKDREGGYLEELITQLYNEIDRLSYVGGGFIDHNIQAVANKLLKLEVKDDQIKR